MILHGKDALNYSKVNLVSLEKDGTIVLKGVHLVTDDETTQTLIAPKALISKLYEADSFNPEHFGNDSLIENKSTIRELYDHPTATAFGDWSYTVEL